MLFVAGSRQLPPLLVACETPFSVVSFILTDNRNLAWAHIRVDDYVTLPKKKLSTVSHSRQFDSMTLYLHGKT